MSIDGFDFEGRIPPHDLGAEQALISACMLSLEAADHVLSVCRPEECYSEAHRRILEAVEGLRDAGTPPDAVSVATWLQDHDRLQQVGGVLGISQLLAAAPSIGLSSVEGYAKTVRQKARLRAMILLCQRSAAQAYLPVEDTRAYLEGVEQAVYDLNHDELAGAAIERSSESSKRLIARLTKGELTHRVPTGFDRFDRIIKGGLRRQGLVVVAGQTSMGKSAFAMNVVVNVAKDPRLGVFVASLEMPHDELVERMACAESGVSSELIEMTVQARARGDHHGSLSPTQWSRYMNAHTMIAALPIYVSDEPGQTISAIRAKARRAAALLRQEGRSLGLVAIDYLQLLKPLPGPKSRTREQEVAELSRNLKGLAKDLDVPVLALSQLNDNASQRPKDQRRPRLSDLRESKAIANDADIVAFVHREEYEAERYGGDSSDRQMAEIIVAKHRGGRTGTAQCIYDRTRTRFENLPDDYRDERGAA